MDGDEAVFDIGVLDALHVTILDLGKRHILVVHLVIVVDQISNKLLCVRVCLLLDVEVLIEEELVLLLDRKRVNQHLLRLVVQDAHQDALVLHLHLLEEVDQLRLVNELDDRDAALVADDTPKLDELRLVLFQEREEKMLLFTHGLRVLLEAHEHGDLLVRRDLIEHRAHLILVEGVPES